MPYTSERRAHQLHTTIWIIAGLLAATFIVCVTVVMVQDSIRRKDERVACLAKNSVVECDTWVAP